MVLRIASLLFIVLYVLSALFYPNNFSPWVNFFCDLFQETINANPTFGLSEILAILALFSISSVVALFFVKYAQRANWPINKKRLVIYSGCLSALLLSLIFLPLHDEFILLSSVIGFPAICLVLIDLIKEKNRNHSLVGTITVLTLTFYNVIFYLDFLEPIWPWLQKFCIVLCLIWCNQIIKPISRKRL